METPDPKTGVDQLKETLSGMNADFNNAVKKAAAFVIVLGVIVSCVAGYYNPEILVICGSIGLCGLAGGLIATDFFGKYDERLDRLKAKYSGTQKTELDESVIQVESSSLETAD